MRPTRLLSKLSLRALLRVPSYPAALRATRRSIAVPAHTVTPRESLDAAYRWLCAAQDAAGDGGVAGWYHLAEGWSASYPETTGYIIPTFLRYAALTGTADARVRALRMAEWETEVQMPTGAVRSGLVSHPVGPAVFNTGQVLFGWAAACHATRDERIARAAARAGEWLLEQQDEDGAWRKNLSLLARGSVHTYNVRSAWGLALAGHALGEKRFIDAARRNCDWALRQQRENGWFAHTGFTDGEDPLLHTIGYVLEGLLGMGLLLGEDRYIEAARKGVVPLVELWSQGRGLRGRYDAHWKPTVGWRCLTGEAQVALVLHRLARFMGVASYAETGRGILEGLTRIQDVAGPFEGTRGALPGSQPLWGAYCPFVYINWASKFFMDALILQIFGVDVESERVKDASPAAQGVAPALEVVGDR
jgi:hypothetical protein